MEEGIGSRKCIGRLKINDSDPIDSQSLNRYSYVWNNPLNATDPSGYFLDSIIDIIVVIISVVVEVVCEGCGAGRAIATWYFGGGYDELFTQSISAFSPQASPTASSNSGFSSGEASEFNRPNFSIRDLGSLFDSEEAEASRIANISDVTVGFTYSDITGGKFVNGADGNFFLSLFDSLPSFEEVLISDETLDVLDNLLDVIDYIDTASDVLIVGAILTGGASAVVGVAGKVLAKLGKKALRKLVKILREKAKKRKAKPKQGSAGGPSAGKNPSNKVKDQVRAESDDTCVFCQRDTIRSKTPDPRRSNIDHAIPRSRRGNATLDNLQNTCQTCNLQKGARTTEEFLRDLSKGERLKSSGL